MCPRGAAPRSSSWKERNSRGSPPWMTHEGRAHHLRDFDTHSFHSPFPHSGILVMRSLLFAANWKMHQTPREARAFATRFCALTRPRPDRALWFSPPAVSLEATAAAFQGRQDAKVG